MTTKLHQGDMRDDGSSDGERRGLPWGRMFFGALFLAALVVVVSHLGDARRFAALVERARPAWLLLAAALQAATYVCAGAIWWLVLRRSPRPQPLRTLVLLSVAKLFTDQAVPSGGLTGSALVIRGVVRRGAPLATASSALVVVLLGFYAAMIVATAASFSVLSTTHHDNRAFEVLGGSLLLVATVVCTTLVLLVRGNAPKLRRRLARFRPLAPLLAAFAEVPRDVLRDRTAIAGSFALQLATIALDAATLDATLRAVGEHVDASTVLTTFVFASIAEMTGLVPGGLGTFETTSVAVLHLFGVSLEPALTATLLLRGFTFWLPMIPGVVIARRELRPR